MLADRYGMALALDALRGGGGPTLLLPGALAVAARNALVHAFGRRVARWIGAAHAPGRARGNVPGHEDFQRFMGTSELAAALEALLPAHAVGEESALALVAKPHEHKLSVGLVARPQPADTVR